MLEVERLLPLGLLVISSLLTADILDGLLVLEGDCGALLSPGLRAVAAAAAVEEEETDPARVRLRPVRGMVLSPLALSREKQS